jgi:exopolysaccharide biosynthesis predicted pyruvyltransferase EpsI
MEVKRPQLVMIVAILVGFVTLFNLRYSIMVDGILGMINKEGMNEPSARFSKEQRQQEKKEENQQQQNASFASTLVKKDRLISEIDIAALLSNFTIPKGINPDDSIVPEAMNLFDTDHPGIRKRHECIVEIRELAHQLLDPHLRPFAEHQKPVLVVDPAYHPNVGDSMIYKGELNFLKHLGYENAAVETCGYAQSGPFAKIKCRDYLKQDNTGSNFAVWQGGGNFGDLWYHTHRQRVASFEPLMRNNFTVVAMPSSFHYDSDKVRQEDTARIRNGIAAGLGHANLGSEVAKQESAARVVFSWRERKSLDKATEEYPFATNLLVPDIAFHLGPYAQRISQQKEDLQLDIVFFLRTDKESIISSSHEDLRTMLNTLEGGDDLIFGVVDWNTRFALWPSDDFLFTESAIQMLSLGKVVICDRLHASILSYLSGIPFVYIDQATAKITSTLEVAFDCWEGCKDGETAMWARAQTIEEAVRVAAGFIHKYNL